VHEDHAPVERSFAATASRQARLANAMAALQAGEHAKQYAILVTTMDAVVARPGAIRTGLAGQEEA
jgi:hypothetical protein